MDPASPTYQDQFARWGDDREPELIAVSIILIIATCLATALRFWAQRSIKKQWAADNILIVFAAVFAVAVAASSIVGVNADLMNWTAVECCVGTVCASLPPMAPLLKRSPQSSPRNMSKIWANFSLPRFRWPLWSSYQSRSQFKDSQEEEDSTILRDLRASDRKSPANGYSRAVPNEWVV
ncbi:MAG: hypothetical protein L6R42_008469 [Xanthoria sp. 1 TBL-2021]|nr:MAG: hypothetical protein L6R42_008469 [Xanthoria sp. 1 TBL-2021]